MCPIKLRGAIYMALAGLPVFISFFTGVVDKLSDGKPVVVHWAIWTLLSMNSAYQMLLALRAFIDGTAERGRQVKSAEDAKLQSVDKPAVQAQ